MKKVFKIFSIIAFIVLIALLCRFLLPVSSDSEPGFPEETVLPSEKPQPQISEKPPEPFSPQQTPEPVDYEVNYSAIPEAIMPKLTEADKAAYKAVVRAYFNYETEAEFAASDKIQSLKQLLELCCPVFYSDVEEDSIQISGNRILWEYSDSQQEHNRNIEIFENVINEYRSYAEKSDNDTTKALLLYKLFCSRVIYDNPTEDYLKGEAPRPDKMCDNCIDVFLSGRGICHCLARGYAFLLNQTGIEAFTADADGGVGHHEWTVLKLDGKWYYADPTWDRGGKKLYYFGMTADRRAADGYLLENTEYFAGGDFPMENDFSITDTRFKMLYTGQCSGEFYEIDVKNNLILIYRLDPEGKLYLYEPGTFYLNAG